MARHSESRLKTKMIGVRATPREKEVLQARARSFGVSMGALCRQIVFGITPSSKLDMEAIRELAVTRADLGRLGGLLKGWLAGSFPQNRPQPQTHVEIIKLLNEIDQAQKNVVAVIRKLDDRP